MADEEIYPQSVRDTILFIEEALKRGLGGSIIGQDDQLDVLFANNQATLATTRAPRQARVRVSELFANDPIIEIPETVSMFKEEMFKTGFVAVRTISPFEANVAVVDIYVLASPVYREVPELVYGSRLLSRRFAEPINALMRHSNNWIDKLERMGQGTPYWAEEAEEWGSPETHGRIFLRPPTIATNFVDRLAAVGRASPRTTTLSPQIFTDAIEAALRTEAPAMGAGSRALVVRGFARELTTRIGS